MPLFGLSEPMVLDFISVNQINPSASSSKVILESPSNTYSKNSSVCVENFHILGAVGSLSQTLLSDPYIT